NVQLWYTPRPPYSRFLPSRAPCRCASHQPAPLRERRCLGSRVDRRRRQSHAALTAILAGFLDTSIPQVRGHPSWPRSRNASLVSLIRRKETGGGLAIAAPGWVKASPNMATCWLMLGNSCCFSRATRSQTGCLGSNL